MFIWNSPATNHVPVGILTSAWTHAALGKPLVESEHPESYLESTVADIAMLIELPILVSAVFISEIAMRSQD